MSTFDASQSVHATKNWEFSKKLTFVTGCAFGFHLFVFLASALFNIGQTVLIRDSLTSLAPYYVTIITGYLGKSAFENFDINRNRMREKQMECDSNG